MLGHDAVTGKEFRVPRDAFRTHFHLIGGTGKGKTTAIHTMLQSLLMDDIEPACFIIVDRLGNFAQELMLWMASTDYCTDDVRDRLVYIQPSREDLVLPFNPLLHDSPAHGYYKVERATEIILRAWESVNIEAMPRLARWTFNAFWAAAQLNLTITDCVHFLMPGSPYHEQLLNVLPTRLQAEWQEIATARSGEAIRILESSRNRLKPYFESDILRRMFGASSSRLDVHRFMAEAKIVIIDLAPRNRLSTQLANTIGALIINEVLATARSLARDVRYPTYLFLDEFQNFVGPDIESALPEVRQLGLRLVLSHQSFSQLERGDYDITSMIFQAQSRMVFGVQGEDADVLANEIASITYEGKRIKDEIYSRRQLQKGHRIVELTSSSSTSSTAQERSKTRGEGRSTSESESSRHGSTLSEGESEGRSSSIGDSEGETRTDGYTTGKHQTLVPEHEEFSELASRTYVNFDEQRTEWAKRIRNLPTGHALIRLVNDDAIRQIRVKRAAAGHLRYDMQTLAREFPEALTELDALIERNFRSDIFVPAKSIDAEIDARIRRVANGHVNHLSESQHGPDHSNDQRTNVPPSNPFN